MATAAETRTATGISRELHGETGLGRELRGETGLGRELRGEAGLGRELRDLMRAIRVFKRHHPPSLTAVPAGMAGILAAVGEDGSHVKDLAVRCALDPSTVSRAVSALVRHGLVERMADPADGRASVLGLTDAGREALCATENWYDEVLATALARWTPQELEAFATMLRRFAGDLLRHLDRPPVTVEQPAPLPRESHETHREAAR